MILRRFKEVEGRYVEKIYGQERLAFSMSDNEDMYDLIEWAKRGGYQGSVIMFYDHMTGDVYRPFEKKRNVLYGKPEFIGGFYYFLQGDYDEKKVTLYRYLPGGMSGTAETILDVVVQLDIADVNLYNLRLMGDGVHITSQDKEFCSYYPDKFSFPIKPNESACFILGDKVYLEAWIEEGWDTENDRATENYVFYHKVIVKDFAGNTLSEEIGSLYQAQDGNWWIS